MMIELGPNERCIRCGKKPRKNSQMQIREYVRHKPYCSYHCQEWARLEDAHRYARSLRSKQ